jgi:hypothetical protein
VIFHLAGPCQSKFVVAKDVVCMLVASIHIIESGINSGRSIVRLLGVDKRNIKRGVDWQISLNTQKDAFWLTYKRARPSDSIVEVVNNLMKNWWENETIVSPNMKDIIEKRIAAKLYEVHPTHYLQVFQVNVQ